MFGVLSYLLKSRQRYTLYTDKKNVFALFYEQNDFFVGDAVMRGCGESIFFDESTNRLID